MSASLEEISYLGWRGIRFANSVYEAVLLPEKGANLIRLFHKPAKTALLHEPTSRGEAAEKPFEFGTPVLFFPNRIEDGRFNFEGRTYRFPVNENNSNCHLHGFLHDTPWKLEDSEILTEESVRISVSREWGENPDDPAVFPHRSRFTLSFELSLKGLRQEFSVENKSGQDMPVGFGYHTSFSVPSSENFRVMLSIGKKWEMSDRHIPAGGFLSAAGDDVIDLTELRNRVFGHYTLRARRFEGRSLYGAVIRNPAKMYQIDYTFDPSFKNLVIWNKTGEDGFLCIEPQTCAINAFNSKLSDEETGRIALGQGAVFKTATMLSLRESGISGEAREEKQ